MESPRVTKWRVEGSMSPGTPRHHHTPASSDEDLVTKKLVAAAPPSPAVSTPSPLASTPRRHSMPQQVQKLSTPRRSSSPARTPSTLGSVGRIRSNARADSPSGNNLVCQTHKESPIFFPGQQLKFHAPFCSAIHHAPLQGNDERRVKWPW